MKASIALAGSNAKTLLISELVLLLGINIGTKIHNAPIMTTANEVFIIAERNKIIDVIEIMTIYPIASPYKYTCIMVSGYGEVNEAI